MLDGERRVRFKTPNGIKGEGILIAQDRAGGAVIPDGIHEVLYLKHGEFEILPQQDPPKVGWISPQQA